MLKKNIKKHQLKEKPAHNEIFVKSLAHIARYE